MNSLGYNKCTYSCSNGKKILVEGKKKIRINSKCKCSRKLHGCDWLMIFNSEIVTIENSADWACEMPVRLKNVP